mgnify:CR=1 FL=1|jgi:hypothetical protein
MTKFIHLHCRNKNILNYVTFCISPSRSRYYSRGEPLEVRLVCKELI